MFSRFKFKKFSKRYKQSSPERLVLYERETERLYIRSLLPNAKQASITEQLNDFEFNKFTCFDAYGLVENISDADLDALSSVTKEMNLKSIQLKHLNLDENTWIKFIDLILINAQNVDTFKIESCNLFDNPVAVETYFKYRAQLKNLHTIDSTKVKTKSKQLINFFKGYRKHIIKVQVLADQNLLPLSKALLIKGTFPNLETLDISLRMKEGSFLITSLEELKKTSLKVTLSTFIFKFFKAMKGLKDFQLHGLRSKYPQYVSSLVLDLNDLFKRIRRNTAVNISFDENILNSESRTRYATLGKRLKFLDSRSRYNKAFLLSPC
eukprot:snap_masked-scaffold_13-processed-gene-5.31-mRNA-1 protein AED:1.00 eAED:1.00 QI:0/0/0/0/1/1/2/0/322